MNAELLDEDELREEIWRYALDNKLFPRSMKCATCGKCAIAGCKHAEKRYKATLTSEKIRGYLLLKKEEEASGVSSSRKKKNKKKKGR